jgi:hypothetical protein
MVKPTMATAIIAWRRPWPRPATMAMLGRIYGKDQQDVGEPHEDRLGPAEE